MCLLTAPLQKHPTPLPHHPPPKPHPIIPPNRTLPRPPQPPRRRQQRLMHIPLIPRPTHYGIEPLTHHLGHLLPRPRIPQPQPHPPALTTRNNTKGFSERVDAVLPRGRVGIAKSLPVQLVVEGFQQLD